MNKSNVVVIIVLVILIAFGVYAWTTKPTMAPENNPKPIGESIEEPNITHPLINVTTPTVGELVTSPLNIEGKAKGNWFFEATFPIKLLDQDGDTIAEGFATAQGDWMTTQFVPFTASIEFTKPAEGNGTLLLLKSNASGLPENDDEIAIPISF